MMIPRRNGNGLDFWDEVLPDSFFTEKETKIMKTDLKEKDGKYLLEIDVPGYDKEDIKIELHDGYLTVSAEKNEEKEDKHAKYLKRERFTGMCSRSYYVGENVTEEDTQKYVNEAKSIFENVVALREGQIIDIQVKRENEQVK